MAKTLTSTSQNPYQMGRAVASGAPAALDAFSIQVHPYRGPSGHRQT